MSQSCACSLFLAKTNEKDACFRVPESSSLPQSCAKEKSSGVEIERRRKIFIFEVWTTTRPTKESLSFPASLRENCSFKSSEINRLEERNTYISLKISTCLHKSIHGFTRSKIENDRILDHVISVSRHSHRKPLTS